MMPPLPLTIILLLTFLDSGALTFVSIFSPTYISPLISNTTLYIPPTAHFWTWLLFVSILF
ncbi:hypothetical protein BJ138DRAFT_1161600 [Hygrophoropsis aurantiaca]|uniref:Uncharacterized protein n=1 Tax=Hygrophoropsis aurantiaca TaxID=72124 RepID=A0ACB8A1F2_9AGAM|nr:hypothetical protein BJ138DRAFT_1161600 [Hygrophoropsis aurantiaca]